MTQTIYNIKTGEQKTLDSVDAREHLATGRWGVVPTFTEDRSPEVNQDATSPEANQDATSPEAYEERKAIFEQAESDKSAQADAITAEIAKSKGRKQK